MSDDALENETMNLEVEKNISGAECSKRNLQISRSFIFLTVFVVAPLPSPYLFYGWGIVGILCATAVARYYRDPQRGSQGLCRCRKCEENRSVVYAPCERISVFNNFHHMAPVKGLCHTCKMREYAELVTIMRTPRGGLLGWIDRTFPASIPTYEQYLYGSRMQYYR